MSDAVITFMTVATVFAIITLHYVAIDILLEKRAKRKEQEDKRDRKAKLVQGYAIKNAVSPVTIQNSNMNNVITPAASVKKDSINKDEEFLRFSQPSVPDTSSQNQDNDDKENKGSGRRGSIRFWYRF